MSPLQTAAQFAAYLHFLRQPENLGKTRDDARRFARLNWERFLPSANEGVGRLLEAIATPAPNAARTKKPARRVAEPLSA